MMREIIVAGAGTGELTPEVMNAVKNADAVCASRRFMSVIPEGKKFIDIKNFSDAFAKIEKESGQVVILVSGDPGIYSLLPLVKKHFPNEHIKVLPGISSLQILCARAGESWSDAVILSGHGRNLRAGKFLNIVERNRLVILFCDRVISPKWACEKLEGISGVSVVIGENLGTESEHVIAGKPEEFINHEFSELSLMLVQNNLPFTPANIHPRDYEFARAEGIVMTNEAVRSVILGRLNMRSDSVLWDIGAGTGSISVSAGLEFPESEIHAVEYKPQAVKVIAENAAKFHLHNIEIHSSRALDIIDKLPNPSHVFIGGTEGELAAILEHIMRIDDAVQIVIACVTLETFSTAYTLMKNLRGFEALQIAISSSKHLTDSSTLMSSHSPIMILSALNKQKFSDIIMQ